MNGLGNDEDNSIDDDVEVPKAKSVTQERYAIKQEKWQKWFCYQ